MARRAHHAKHHRLTRPVALKIAPYLDEDQLEAIAEAATRHAIDAIIATNTTVAREEIAGDPRAGEAGGLSGRPLLARSTAVLRKLSGLLAGRIPLIGVGGILSGEDARAKTAAGASLVQMYTGFIFLGPGLVAAARGALAWCIREDLHFARDHGRRAARRA